MQIVNLIKDSTTEAYPFNWGMTLFCLGCNLSCKMCQGYNYETVTNKQNIIGTAIDLIKKNITPFHDTVIFLGGEPTIWGDSLIDALEYCHDNNLKTKIFSNGVNSGMIKTINNLKLCDAWSIDYKGLANHISEEIGLDGEIYKANLYKSINNIIENKLPLEIRTTFYEGNLQDYLQIKLNCDKIISEAKNKNGKGYFIKWIEQHDARKVL